MSVSHKHCFHILVKMSRSLKTSSIFPILMTRIRQFTTKLDVIPVVNRLPSIEENISEDSPEDRDNNPIRYNVCRDNSPCSKFVFNKRNKQAGSADHQNQFEMTFEDQSAQQECTTSISSADKGYRSFTTSTTQKNVVLPLKMFKLANPFPEPVKIMPSRTVSDQEKADQMQAECRVPKSISKSRRA
ncbi:unnamed protein product [Phaedon cochleariae]|uniref:Uncharacterized protein n=1 Tax=Phaedon cochleariae TaxID=80249 RepID=A0A9P0GSQ9_PHACE|nr:unnamed protein product [Phaedon cochleariae]